MEAGGVERAPRTAAQQGLQAAAAAGFVELPAIPVVPPQPPHEVPDSLGVGVGEEQQQPAAGVAGLTQAAGAAAGAAAAEAAPAGAASGEAPHSPEEVLAALGPQLASNEEKEKGNACAKRHQWRQVRAPSLLPPPPPLQPGPLVWRLGGSCNGSSCNMGVLRRRSLCAPQALRHYERAVELFPDNKEALANQAFVLLKMQRWQEAEGAAERVRLLLAAPCSPPVEEPAAALTVQVPAATLRPHADMLACLRAMHGCRAWQRRPAAAHLLPLLPGADAG